MSNNQNSPLGLADLLAGLFMGRVQVIPVIPREGQTVQDAIAAVSLPAWSEVCNKSYAGCSDAWKKLLGPIAGVK